jgi:hypothetical protein
MVSRHSFKSTKTPRIGRPDIEVRRTRLHWPTQTPMPEQNAEMHLGFHGRFDIRCNRFYRQVRSAFQHPPPISGCSLRSPQIARLSNHRSRRERVGAHRRSARLFRKHVPRTIVVPEENDGQTSVRTCRADAHVALPTRPCATELKHKYRHHGRRSKPLADQRSQALLAGTHVALHRPRRHHQRYPLCFDSSERDIGWLLHEAGTLFHRCRNGSNHLNRLMRRGRRRTHGAARDSSGVELAPV